MISARIHNKIYFLLLLLAIHINDLSAQIIPSDYKQNKSFTYDEAISYYKLLDDQFDNATLIEKGTTDIGRPLHLFVMYNGNFEKEVVHGKIHPVMLVLNGIHPGEPDGIDASLHLAEWILTKHDSVLNELAVCIIPVYNIGGALNRSCCSRANQNGPEAYGFRGNAKNLDLNRDFIKLDSKNANSFVQIFQWIQPDYFVDTHVSNGADYQYTFTLLPTLRDKIWPAMGDYMYEEILPAAYNYMDEKGWPVAPYVNSVAQVPDSGIVAFYDSPRYSTGYAALFNVPGFVIETHMLKPFPSRVESTLEFLKFSVLYMYTNGRKVKELKKTCEKEMKSEQLCGINWTVDTVNVDRFNFLGYEASYKESKLTGADRLYYDTQRPFVKEIPFFNHYVCTDKAKLPDYYIIPQAWDEVIKRLKINGVELDYLDKDSSFATETYKIVSYQASKVPYEGHHMKRNIETAPIALVKQFYKGDVIVKTGTRYDYFVASVLEPTAYDSYFTWGFFDSMLQQKEWFSTYVWEDKAWKLYLENEDLRREFDAQKQNDTNFAKSSWEQLYFIYKNSPNFEESYMEYPVYRVYSKEE